MALERELLMTNEVAPILRVTEWWLRQRRQLGGGPKWSKIGGRVVYSRTDIEEYINQNKRG
jgi:predicted DNA-binding transcriptional regulator AlpA